MFCGFPSLYELVRKGALNRKHQHRHEGLTLVPIDADRWAVSERVQGIYAYLMDAMRDGVPLDQVVQHCAETWELPPTAVRWAWDSLKQSHLPPATTCMHAWKPLMRSVYMFPDGYTFTMSQPWPSQTRNWTREWVVVGTMCTRCKLRQDAGR